MKLDQLVREENLRAFAPPETLPHGGAVWSSRHGRDDGAPLPRRHAYFGFAASAAFAVESGEMVSVLHLEDGHLSGDHLWVVKVEVAGQAPCYYAGLALPVREEVSARWVEAIVDELPAGCGELVPADALGLGWDEGDRWVPWVSRALFARDLGEGRYCLPEGIVRKDDAGTWLLAGSSNAHYVREDEVGLSPDQCGWTHQTSRTYTGRTYGWWEKTVYSSYTERRLLLNEGPLEWEFPLREIRARRIRVVHPYAAQAAYAPVRREPPIPLGPAIKRVRRVTASPPPATPAEFVEVPEY